MTTTQRIPELDAVRGLAAVGVVLFHAFPFVFFAGWSCVDLFFVLSGYLITTIILTRGFGPGFLKSFYVRRICRIWPVYFVTLLMVLVLNGLSPHRYPIDTLHWHLLFLQNTSQYFGFSKPPFIHSFGPSWSVAIEEQYYLVWPLLILALGKRSIPCLALMLLIACALGRWLIPGAIDILFTRGDGLAWGCLLAWMLWHASRYPGIRWHHWVIQLTAIVGTVFVAAYFVNFWGEPVPQWASVSFSGFSILFFALIGTCVLYSGSRFLTIFRNPVLRWFGTISYALYMFHVPIFHFTPTILAKIGIESSIAIAVGTWSSIVILPTLSWYLLEKPILSWSAGSK